MWEAEYTKQFKKDYKHCKKRGLPPSGLEAVIGILLEGKPLAERHNSGDPALLRKFYLQWFLKSPWIA